MKKYILGLLLISFSLFSISCTTVPMASPELDAAAKKFKKPSGEANLYIYRKGIYGAAVPIPVLVNDRFVGNLKLNNFQKFSLPSGSYQLKTQGSFNTHKLASIELKKNENMYVEARLLTGILKARVHFKKQSSDVAKPFITNSKLTEHTQDPLSLPAETEKREQQMLAQQQLQQTRQAQVSQASSDTGAKTIASLAALGAGAFMAEMGDSAGAANFVASSLGGILGGRKPQASDFNQANEGASNANLAKAIKSSANQANLVDERGLRNVDDGGQQFKKYADLMYVKYKETGDSKFYDLHKQTVESFQSVIK